MSKDPTLISEFVEGNLASGHTVPETHQVVVSAISVLPVADKDTSSSDEDLYSHVKHNPATSKRKKRVTSGRSNASNPPDAPSPCEALGKKRRISQLIAPTDIQASNVALMQSTAVKIVDKQAAPNANFQSSAILSAVSPVDSTRTKKRCPVGIAPMKRTSDTTQLGTSTRYVNTPTELCGTNCTENSLQLVVSAIDAIPVSSSSGILQLTRHPPSKGPENRLPINYKKSYTDTELRNIRWNSGNPYISCPRDATDRRFHTLIQQDYYETVVTGLDNPVVPQKTIDWKFIRAHEEHFQGVEQACVDRNVFGLTEFKQDWCEEVILQFYATLYVDNNRTIWWMTNGKRYTCTYQEFASFLGFANINNDQESRKTRIHAAKGSLSPSELCALYPASALQKPDYVKGSNKYMLPLPLTLSRIFRRTITPKLGDSGCIRRWAANLLMQFHKGEDFQVVDFIFNEMKNASADKSKCLPFAPFIQHVINKITTMKFKYDRIHESYKPPIPGDEVLALQTNSDGSGNTGNVYVDPSAGDVVVCSSGCAGLNPKFDGLCKEVSFLKLKFEEWESNRCL